MEAQGFEGPILQGAARAVEKRRAGAGRVLPVPDARTGSFEALREVVGSYQRLFDVSRPETGALPATAATLDALRARLGEAGAYTDVLFC